MKLGMFTVPFSSKPLGETLDYLCKLGVQAVELGCGGYPGNAHCNLDELLAAPDKAKAMKSLVADKGMVISALSMHANHVHPNQAEAAAAHETYGKALKVAEMLGVDTLVTFSGCPGDAPGAKYPNWVTCPWPEDFLAILDYQWNECLIPYWRNAAKMADDHGIKVALEMHPGFCVYNPETTLKLRAAAGNAIGANLDPSHLIWQGIDIVAAIRALGDAIHYVHAKDTKVDALNAAVNGVLDTKHYSDELHRSWLFRAVGYGQDALYWKDIVSNLRMVGYDKVMSIEHEDSLMTFEEGLKKAVFVLQQAIMFEDKGEVTWA